MQSVRSILKKVIPKLQAIEENPTLTIIRISTPVSTNPFAGDQNEIYDTNIVVPCIYSTQNEIIQNAGNVTTQQTVHFYLQTDDIIAAETKITPGNITGEITMKDKILFQNRRYYPSGVNCTFGLWTINALKE